MNKHTILTLLVTLSMSVAFGQSPSFDQWFSNNYLVNPAIGGIEQYTDVQLGARQQWSGIEGAPQTLYLSAHLPIGINNQGFTPEPEFSRFRPKKDQYKARNFSHHGVGIVLVQDAIGAFSTTEARATYAYHLPVSGKWTISGGLGIGYLRKALNPGKISSNQLDDPALGNTDARHSLVPQAGLWIYGRKLYFGASYTQYLGTAVENRFIVNGGYRFQLPYSPFGIMPFALARIGGMNQGIDAGIKADWKNRVSLGSTYRSVGDIIVFAGFAPSPLFTVNYYYTVGTRQSVSNLAGLTHELQLSFRLNNKNKVICPQQLW